MSKPDPDPSAELVPFRFRNTGGGRTFCPTDTCAICRRVSDDAAAAPGALYVRRDWPPGQSFQGSRLPRLQGRQLTTSLDFSVPSSSFKC
jgi:hypothetical protein